MSFLAASPLTIVRQRSPWLMSKTACLLVFVLVGAAAFGWKYRQLPPTPPTAPPRATAKVYIHEGKFAVQPAWQEILEPNRSPKSAITSRLRLTNAAG
jgi:hypothetical protein